MTASISLRRGAIIQCSQDFYDAGYIVNAAVNE